MNTFLETEEELKKLFNAFPLLTFHRVGSRECVSPPPLDTDIDLIVDCDITEWLYDNGYQYEGGEYETAEFNSFRKGSVNVLVSYSTEFTLKFLFATKVCKKLNLKNKQDRITIFEALLYGQCE